jgi:hypothetical protein
LTGSPSKTNKKISRAAGHPSILQNRYFLEIVSFARKVEKKRIAAEAAPSG